MTRCLPLLVLLLFILLAACGGSSAEPSPTTGAGSAEPTAAPTASPTPEPSPTTPPTPTPTPRPPVASPTATAAPSPTPQSLPDLPATPVGSRLAEVLAVMNAGGEAVTVSFVNDVFAPATFEDISATDLALAIRGFVTAYRPFDFDGFATPPGETEAVAILTGRTGDSFYLSIAVEPEPPHRLTALFFQPVPQAADVDSWTELGEHAMDLAPSASLLVAEVTGAACDPIHALNADTLLPIGSTFKLYVLGALAMHVERGEASWDEVLAVRDESKSLPTGVLQDSPAGTELTLLRHAELMISISDNTATDHLIQRLGRDAIVAAMTDMGHTDTAATLPLLTTREMFALKLLAPVELAERYIAASVDERRAILESEIAALDLPPAALDLALAWNTPRHIDTLEWFASAEDICRALVWLRDASERDGLEPLRDILSQNPGIPLDDDVWSWAGYKGGSEPGVLNMSWMLERGDGRVFTLILTFADTERVIDEQRAFELVLAAMKLLGAQP